MVLPSDDGDGVGGTGGGGMKEYLYRFVDLHYVHVDDDGCCSSGYTRAVVYLYRYEVLKKTEKGRWIKLYDFSDEKKFVLDGHGKRFAYPTIDLAKESFVMRKNRQIKHGERYINRANAALSVIESGIYTENFGMSFV